MTLGSETAVQGSDPLSGGKSEKLGSVFRPQKYSAGTVSSIPSVEVAGKLALVVSPGDRLFAVGAFAAEGAR